MKCTSFAALLLLVSTTQAFFFGGGRPGGWGGHHGGRPGGHMDSAQYTQLWTSSGLVPTKIPTAPPPAMVAYNYRKIMMGEMVKTEDMMSPPMVKWRSERGALYTVAIFDFGFPDGVQYGHWVVSNVRDPWSLQWGDEVFKKDQPFFIVSSGYGIYSSFWL